MYNCKSITSWAATRDNVTSSASDGAAAAAFCPEAISTARSPVISATTTIGYNMRAKGRLLSVIAISTAYTCATSSYCDGFVCGQISNSDNTFRGAAAATSTTYRSLTTRSSPGTATGTTSADATDTRFAEPGVVSFGEGARSSKDNLLLGSTGKV